MGNLPPNIKKLQKKSVVAKAQDECTATQGSSVSYTCSAHTFTLTDTQVHDMQHCYNQRALSSGRTFIARTYFRPAVESRKELSAVFSHVNDLMGAKGADSLDAHCEQLSAFVRHCVHQLHQPARIAHMCTQLGRRHAELREDGFSGCLWDVLLDALSEQHFGDFDQPRPSKSKWRCKWPLQHRGNREHEQQWMQLLRFMLHHMKTGFEEHVHRQEQIQQALNVHFEQQLCTTHARARSSTTGGSLQRYKHHPFVKQAVSLDTAT